jgi:hypothetical protein
MYKQFGQKNKYNNLNTMKHLYFLSGLILLTSCQRKLPWVCEKVVTTTIYAFGQHKVYYDKNAFSYVGTKKEKNKLEKDNYSYVEKRDDSSNLINTIETKLTCQ